ncbi:unnamed protein product [Thelazia callipaeda]|uniref:Secreted protein n=1 Tax=Thelazia callipaeda TaxID=103827 RepID=A0A0N5D2N4_THECL|nr:unnamed protein product [Thelazia callipaeda]
MKINVWIIILLAAVTVILFTVIVLIFLIVKLIRNRIRPSRSSVVVRPKIAKPIDAFDESVASYSRMPIASVVIPSQNQSQKTNSNEIQQYRTSSKKSSWVSDTSRRYALTGHSKHRNEHFVDRDPPSHDSRCDYLDPLDLDLGELQEIQINNFQTRYKNTDRPVIT